MIRTLAAGSVLALAAVLLDAPQASAYVYAGSSGPEEIVRTNVDGSGRVGLAVGGLSVFGVEARDGRVWWADLATGAIGRMNVDGSGMDATFIAGGSNTRDVAVGDTHVWWSRSVSNAIGRANLDGSGANQSFIATAASASAIAVDDQHVYWASSTGGAIGRANLDGGGVTQSFIAPGGQPLGVAVDDQHVYWTDADNGTIGRANLDGTGANPSWITGASVPSGIAVDGQHVYWVNGASNRVGRANLDGSGVNQSFLAGLNGTTGVAVDALPVAPALSVAAAPASARLGAAVRANARLTGGVGATGTVELRAYAGSDMACTTPLFGDTITVAGDGTYQSAAFTPARAGSYRWVARYGGDAANRAVETACGAAGSLVTVAPREWELALEAPPEAVVGQPLHVVAQLSAPPDACARGWGCLAPAGREVERRPQPITAEGARGERGRDGVRASACLARGDAATRCQGWGDDGLRFRLYGPDDPTCARRPVYAAGGMLSGTVAGSHPSGDFVPTLPGEYVWTASFWQPDDQGPTIACADGARVTVVKATPALTVAASPGVEIGGRVHATGTLTGGYEAGDEVAVALHGPDDASCAAAPAFSAVATAGDDGAFATEPVALERAGTYRWVVSYGGDERNEAVATACDKAGAAVRVTPRVEPPPPPPDPGLPPAEPAPGPPPPAAGPAPAAPAPAIAHFALPSRCVRPATGGGTVAVPLRFTTARADAVQVTVQRALGTKGLDRCPPRGGSGRFAGRYRTVTTLRDVRTQAAAASRGTGPRAAATAPLARRLTLRLRLEPGLYRLTVRVQLDRGRLSAPKRRFLRVLEPR